MLYEVITPFGSPAGVGRFFLGVGADEPRGPEKQLQFANAPEDRITSYNVCYTKLLRKGLQSRYEEHHHIRYSKTAIDATAELAHRYINDRFLPDKAIDVMDEVGAFFRLNGKTGRTIGVRDVEP